MEHHQWVHYDLKRQHHHQIQTSRQHHSLELLLLLSSHYGHLDDHQVLSLPSVYHCHCHYWPS